MEPPGDFGYSRYFTASLILGNPVSSFGSVWYFMPLKVSQSKMLAQTGQSACDFLQIQIRKKTYPNDPAYFDSYLHKFNLMLQTFIK
jgi:hypothetical protein